MKKTLLLLMLAMSGLVSSCGDDEEKKEDPQPVAVDPAATHTGQWNIIHSNRVIFDSKGNQVGAPKDETNPSGAFTVSFSGQGGYEEKINGRTTTGTYIRDNVLLTVNIPQPLAFPAGKHYIDSLATNRMVLRDTVVSNGFKNITVLKLVR